MSETAVITCDLCGSQPVSPEDVLLKLYAAHGNPGSRIDICRDCRDRPVADLAVVIGARRAALQAAARENHRVTLFSDSAPGTPIEELRLSVLAYNGLKREGINTIEFLAGCSEDRLLDIRNFGAGCIREVRTALEARGLALNGAQP